MGGDARAQAGGPEGSQGTEGTRAGRRRMNRLAGVPPEPRARPRGLDDLDPFELSRLCGMYGVEAKDRERLLRELRARVGPDEEAVAGYARDYTLMYRFGLLGRFAAALALSIASWLAGVPLSASVLVLCGLVVARMPVAPMALAASVGVTRALGLLHACGALCAAFGLYLLAAWAGALG